MGDDVSAAPTRPTVLIAEDQFLVARAICDLLQRHGFDPIGPVSSVDAGVAMLESVTPDAAILDVDLHGCVVTPIAEALQRRGRPFLFVTGYAGLTLLPQELREHPCLCKPYDSAALIDRLRSMVGEVAA